MTLTNPTSDRPDSGHDAFEAALSDVAATLGAGTQRLAPPELVRVRTRRRLLRVVAGSARPVHHDLPAA